MSNRLETFKFLLEDMTFSSKYVFLEEGKDDEELKKIAEKRGVVLPSKDLAVFKTIYAFTDTENKNGCTLPMEEVDTSLQTLVGKAIDLDHFRKRTIGTWIDVERNDKEIIAYGTIWKNNFPEEFDEIKRLMEDGKLKVSFEAWGDRIYKGTSKKHYDLTNIEWAGGALLLTTQPAFANAKVLELAKEMTAPQNFIYERGTDAQKEELEEARYHFQDYETIARLLGETKCPSCQAEYMFSVSSIDFENAKTKVKCMNCSCIYNIDLEPSTEIEKKGKKIKQIQPDVPSSKGSIEDIENFVGTDEELEMQLSSQFEGEELVGEDTKKIEEAKKLTYKQRQDINDDMFAVIVTVKNKVTGEPRKIRMFPIHDPAHVRNALARLPQATETLNKLGVSPETVKKKILKRAKELKMTDLLKRHQQGGSIDMEELLKKYAKSSLEELATFLDSELDKIKTELATMQKDIEDSKTNLVSATAKIEEANKMIEASNKTIEEQKAKIKVFEDEKAAIEKSRIDALVKERREKLGEDAKDLKDEDILDDVKYENATLKKIIKEKMPENANFEIGSKDKKVDSEAFATQSRIHEKAFPKTGKK